MLVFKSGMSCWFFAETTCRFLVCHAGFLWKSGVSCCFYGLLLVGITNTGPCTPLQNESSPKKTRLVIGARVVDVNTQKRSPRKSRNEVPTNIPEHAEAGMSKQMWVNMQSSKSLKRGRFGGGLFRKLNFLPRHRPHRSPLVHMTDYNGPFDYRLNFWMSGTNLINGQAVVQGSKWVLINGQAVQGPARVAPQNESKKLEV
ncbi:hypothetical protein ACFE04_015642 [Oxalis oulophora]